MRKITQQAVQCFLGNVEFTKGNTKVRHYCDGTAKMFLHNNLIAQKISEKLEITTSGWNTVTTRERLNGLPNVQVNQKNHVLYLNGKEWDGSLIVIE